MQVPIGVSGVHAVPNTLHSHGFRTPLSTSPHWQALGSATRTPGTENSRSASISAYFSRTRSAECEMNPSPRHSKCGRSSKTSAIASNARVLPSHGTTRLYWFSTSQRPSRSCTRIIWIACRMSSGSKPAITIGLP